MGEAKRNQEQAERRKQEIVSLAENLYIAATMSGRYNAETPYTPSSAISYATAFIDEKARFLETETK